jgi:hypothetical protein
MNERAVSSSNFCLQESNAIRIVLKDKKCLASRRLILALFNKIVQALVDKSLEREGGGGNTSTESAELESKGHVLKKKGGCICYKIETSLLLIQNFIGSNLSLRAEPMSNSFFLIFTRFGNLDCIPMNGEIRAIVGENAEIKNLGNSNLWGS